jgi:drug/metabolite transporter (DMT)-like permease
MMLAAIAVFGIQTLCFKSFNRGYMKNLAGYFLFNTLYFAVVVAVLAPFGLDFSGLHARTVALAAVFGLVFIASILCYMKAMESGPLSLSSLAFSFGLLVPILAGAALWNERLSLLQGAGLLLLLFTFYLGAGSPGAESKKVNVRWLVCSVLALVGNGTLMALLKAHQSALPGREVHEFLVLAFGTAALLSLVLFLLRRFRYKETAAGLKSGAFALLALGTGATTAFGNLVSLVLSGRVPAYVQFPVINGGVVFVSSVLSVLVFKEKLTRRAWAGLALGLAALVMICL